MYRLTPRMMQHFRRDLERYHDLFTGGRCSGWELEELLVRAILSDSQAHHHAIWTEKGRDDEADIRVQVNGTEHLLQVKSGEVNAGRLVLSGHRLGRFQGDLIRITDYLRSRTADFLSVAYRKVDDATGRRHIYQISYVESTLLHQLDANSWERPNSSYKQESDEGVIFTITPSMSWQVWWRIPLAHVDQEQPIEIA